MPDKHHKSDLKSEVAEHKARDENGHFIHVEKPKTGKAPLDPIGKLFSKNVHYSKNKDDLLDVHIGNPLHKIVGLLEEIKRQKAFSFTLKGSLGVAGVILALSVFGILGAGNLLCDKGTQTEIGTIKVLKLQEKDPSSGIPLYSQLLDFLSPKLAHSRIVLVKNDNSTIHLSLTTQTSLTAQTYANYSVAVTGGYDTCASSLKINTPEAIEIIQP